MRQKNDTIIKYYQLANTMYLTNEEFGILIRKIMMEDDNKELRYENLDSDTAQDLRDMEQQWKFDYQEARKKNPMLGAANSTLHGQVKNSKDSFYRMKDNMDKKEMYVELKNGKISIGKQVLEEIEKYDLTIADIQQYMEIDDEYTKGKHDVREILKDMGHI